MIEGVPSRETRGFWPPIRLLFGMDIGWLQHLRIDSRHTQHVR